MSWSTTLYWALVTVLILWTVHPKLMRASFAEASRRSDASVRKFEDALSAEQVAQAIDVPLAIQALAGDLSGGMVLYLQIRGEWGGDQNLPAPPMGPRGTNLAYTPSPPSALPLPFSAPLPPAVALGAGQALGEASCAVPAPRQPSALRRGAHAPRGFSGVSPQKPKMKTTTPRIRRSRCLSGAGDDPQWFQDGPSQRRDPRWPKRGPCLVAPPPRSPNEGGDPGMAGRGGESPEASSDISTVASDPSRPILFQSAYLFEQQTQTNLAL
eukprot:9036200-Pyramimonas_sp.AAC.3